MNTLYEKVMEWKTEHNCLLEQPVKKELIIGLKRAFSFLPKELEQFYEITNVLECEWFKILPIENIDRIKQTWNSIQHANCVETTDYLQPYIRDNPRFLNDFLVFSDIGGLLCAAFNKKDSTIWYEDEEGFCRTDLTLIEFIDTVLLEVEEINWITKYLFNRGLKMEIMKIGLEIDSQKRAEKFIYE